MVSPNFDTYCGTIHGMSDVDELKRLHHDVTIELGWRSSGHSTPINAELGALTVMELQGILDQLFDQMMSILSNTEAALCDARYAGRELDRGSEFTNLFSSAECNNLAAL